KELDTFDTLYLSAKEDSFHRKEHSDLKEIDSKLEALLKKYDLDDALHAFRMKYKYGREKIYGEMSGSSSVHHEPFEDKRVLKLWETAKDDKDLSAEELDAFYTELREQEGKLDEYNTLLKSFKQTEHNEIHGHEEHENLSATIRRMNAEIEDTFEKLQTQLTEVKRNPFHSKKIRELWNKALAKRNLVPNELDAIKTELRHFEKQLEKLDYHGETLKDAKEFTKDAGKEHRDAYTDELEKHHEKLARKMRKLEAYLNEKISGHEEL
ncbi:Protein C15C8.4, partial [Aphelenchoides avenae]